MSQIAIIIGLAIFTAVIFGGYNSQSAFAADPEDRVVDILENNSVNGTVGVYLKKVNGAVLADYNENFVFEPASTIKVTHHLKAMLEVQDNPAYDLNTPINWYQDSQFSNGTAIVDDPNTSTDERGSGCPVDTGASVDTLENGLRMMMNPSDNRWTQAMRVEFGEVNINALMQSLGMTNSLIQHRIGCAADALANPNKLTLVDAGKLYEEVANGLLNNDTKADFYEIMIQDDNRFEQIVDQEVLGLGLSNTGLQDFKDLRTAALKAGSYSLDGKQYRTVAGWAQIPFKNNSCEVELQEYVFGAFIYKADSLGPQDDIRTQGIDLFHEEIRSALESWAGCETDLLLDKTGPANPVIAGTQISYSVQVDNLGPNDATNVTVIDTLHPGLQYINNTGGCSELNNTLTCDLGTINNGNSISFDVNAGIPADFVYNGGTVVGNEAEVFLDQFDLNYDNNDDSVVNDVIAQTDVAILSFNATQTPSEVMLGDSFDVTLAKNVTNLGPSSPVDIDALIEASGDGLSIVPSPVYPGVDEVEINEEAELFEGTFTVTCEEYGVHELVFSNEIMPVDAEDPDLSNNEAEITIEVECLIPVQINIHPGGDPNSINIVKKTGVIPVAILSTLEGEYGLPVDVNATMIEPQSVHFGPSDVLFNVNPAGGATEFHNTGHIEDSYELDEVTQDGDMDMILHFKAKETELDESDTEGCVKGQIDIEGMFYTFFGCDSINIVP